MQIGPLEVVVIGCKGQQFIEEILPELTTIQEDGFLQVIDLFFARKDVHGTVTVLEVHDLTEEELGAYVPMKEQLAGLLTPEDISLLGETIPPETAAVIVLLEHTWVTRMSERLKRANAVILASSMVPQAALQHLEAELQAAQQQSEHEASNEQTR